LRLLPVFKSMAPSIPNGHFIFHFVSTTTKDLVAVTTSF